MNVLDLFSGIGGFSLGLERAGMRTVAFCEIEPYCRAVLRKHWPNVPIYEDVRTLTADRLRADGIVPDVICGGFPCQDISNAGKRTGIEGSRSGLWSEYARIIGELRPRVVIVENVAALLGRGLDRVLGDLAEIGFDAEWHCIPASAVGAFHRRDRLWIVAYPRGQQHESGCVADEGTATEEFSAPHANGPIGRNERLGIPQCVNQTDTGNDGAARDMADTRCQRQSTGGLSGGPSSAGEILNSGSTDGGQDLANAHGQHGQHGQKYGAEHQLQDSCGERSFRRLDLEIGGEWSPEPDVGRVAHGVPSRVDRLKGLGNAVVPQIPEIIGRAIMQAEGLIK